MVGTKSGKVSVPFDSSLTKSNSNDVVAGIQTAIPCVHTIPNTAIFRVSRVCAVLLKTLNESSHVNSLL